MNELNQAVARWVEAKRQQVLREDLRGDLFREVIRQERDVEDCLVNIFAGIAADDGLKHFLIDAKALKTKVDQNKWTAWMSDRADGIVGTGSTETEAIINLAKQYSVEEAG